MPITTIEGGGPDNVIPGNRVRLKDNPSRVGTLSSHPPIGEGRRRKRVVDFPGGPEAVPESQLEKVSQEVPDAYLYMSRGQYGPAKELRGAITYCRLSGKLANLIYSLNTTNTQFLPYQFKPVLQFLDSPSRGLIIADEVGLGKTIEAGLIWTELRARQDARRLLVVCPAILRQKWVDELRNRFGTKAEIVNAAGVLQRLQSLKDNPYEEFALVASLQGLRAPPGWNNEESPARSAAAELARFLDEFADSDPLFDLVIVDEAHYLRNVTTQSNRFARLLRPVTDGLVLMSATPIQTSSLDLFNLLHLLDEDAFPNEWAYKFSLESNAPIVHLRDRITRGVVPHEEFAIAIEQAITSGRLEGMEQLRHLHANPPLPEVLTTAQGRAQLADLLDRLNPRAKVIVRTLKRHVQEFRVEREPVTLLAQMSQAERKFYEAVTDAVRNKAEMDDVGEGLLLTIPQRQMTSCMPAACLRWMEHGLDQHWDAEDLVDLVGDILNDDLDEEDAQDMLLKARANSPVRLQGKTRRTNSDFLDSLGVIALTIGDVKQLREHDSKFKLLFQNLKIYWKQQPGNKVVLFAFFKDSLNYLHERLTQLGVKSAVLYGGMDKVKILESFKSEGGPIILLASEVAAEGIDLQFSSLLINYDLPWNPARIEQRIGRIDRIGQMASKILIWNLMYADSLDDRVYVSLLSRLKVFEHALGSMEGILGEQVDRLTRDLLSHSLTPKQETDRINQTALALENMRRQQEQLEEHATELVGHSDFILNKVNAAKELGRYINGEDLLAFVRDHFVKTFPGTRFINVDGNPLEFEIEMSIDARLTFGDFLTENRLIGRTRVLLNTPPRLLFDNRLGAAPRRVEKVTQDHPLVRFVSESLRSVGLSAFYPTAALEIHRSKTNLVAPGVYVFMLERWSMSGARNTERLVYQARSLDGAVLLDGDQSEALINAAALLGYDWHGPAKQVLVHEVVAALQDDCRADLYEQYLEAKAAFERENRDRVNAMVGAIEMDESRRVRMMEERIQRHQLLMSIEKAGRRASGFLKMEEGKLRKLKLRNEERVADLRRKEMGSFEPGAVVSGVIKVV